MTTATPRRSTAVATETHSFLAEDALFYAYRQVTGVESRPCACGSLVWADPAAPSLGIVMHNRAQVHRAWARVVDGQD